MRPLEDLRIIALEQYGAGPFGTVHLADLGAEVIKLEDPRSGGDVGRYVPPFQHGEDSLFFETFNRNKRSLGLDVATEAGREVFEDLVSVSDAVYSNMRGDVPAKLRIRYDDIKHINQRIVCVAISGFGMDGPRADEPGYDYVLQALGGWMFLTGEPGSPPAKSGLSLVDYSGGYVGALALLAGVNAARRDGVGCDCDISLYDVAVSMLTYPATWHLTAGWTPSRTARSAHPSLVPFQLFQGSDSEWFLVGCAKEKFWIRLAEIVERPDLVHDHRFTSFAQRAKNKDDLIAVLDRIFTAKPSAHWIEQLRMAGVPTGPVRDVPSTLSDAHTTARALIQETQHPHFGTVRQVVSPVRVGSPADYQYRRAPFRNEDADYVLGDLLGYSRDHIRALLAAGAFGNS